MTHVNKLTAKRNRWLEILSGVDSHSLVSQLATMAWDAFSFSIVNEARPFTRINEENGEPRMNALVHNLLDKTFFESQMLAIRRMVDGYSQRQDREAWSLVGLLQEMRLECQLFTRRALFECEGIDFAFEEIVSCDAPGKRSFGEQAAAMLLPKNNAVLRRHLQMSFLAGRPPSSLDPDDRIDPSVFGNLEMKARASCDDVRLFADKFIAHAASPSNRAITRPDDIPINLDKLKAAHKAFSEIIAFLHVYIFAAGQPLSFLPVCQNNPARYIEEPLIAKPRVEELLIAVRNCSQEWSSWTSWGLDNYAAEFKSLPPTPSHRPS